MSRLVRAAPLIAAGSLGVLLLVHAWLALTSGDGLNSVSGVWLTLARDARDGVFYRALEASGQYGGTRYFPLLFLLIAALMRAGVPPVAAGYAVGLVGAGVLTSGAWRFLRAYGRPPRQAWVGAALVLAPDFVQQTVFAIRVDPLAAGLALWGASMVARQLREAPSARWPLAAASCFTLAVAAKPTAAYCGAAAVLALLCAERRADAGRLALVWIGGCGAMVLAIAVCSHGRAIDAFRACALAGGGPLALLRPMSLAAAAARLRASHLLVATLGLFVTALLFSRRYWCELPVLLCVGAGTAAMLALGTGGTIPLNQSVEPYAAIAVCLVWMSDALAAPPAMGSVVLTTLLLWAGMQTTREIHVLLASDARSTLAAGRSMALDAARRCEEPLLAESPLLPILTARPAILLDPFAFRVAALKYPVLSDHLTARLERREFGCVILDNDPGTAVGAGWYSNVDLGTPVITAVLRNYRFRETAGSYRFYEPLPAASAGGQVRTLMPVSQSSPQRWRSP